MIKNKFKVGCIFSVVVIIILIGCKFSLESHQEPIAKTETGNQYIIDTVDISEHPFAIIDTKEKKIEDIENRIGNELIVKQIQVAKNYLLSQKVKQGESASYIALSGIQINSVIADSEKSTKIMARLNYVKLDNDPNAIEAIPIIIDDQITALPYSPDSIESSNPPEIDHYKDVTLYLYYKDKEFHVLEDVSN